MKQAAGKVSEHMIYQTSCGRNAMGKKGNLKRQLRFLGYDNVSLDRFMVRVGRSLDEVKKELGTPGGGKGNGKSGRK